MRITRMAGGSTSSSCGSGRAHFRSQTGCCICGTKSSSSRFTISQRYSEHFRDCFGVAAASRTGDLCNACVLCVKRWIQRDRQSGLFAQVLDSKKGAGPKHMKEINKRARRREAQQANAHKKLNLKTEPTLTIDGVSESVTPLPTRHNSATSAEVALDCFGSSRNVAPAAPSLVTRSACISGIASCDSPGIGNFIPRLAASSSNQNNATSLSSRSASNNFIKISPSDSGMKKDWNSNAHTDSTSCCCHTKSCPPRTRLASSYATSRNTDNANNSGGDIGNGSHIRSTVFTPTDGATLTRAAAARKSEAASVRALTCSTTTRGASNSRDSVHTTCAASETSDYGSLSTLGSTKSSGNRHTHTSASCGSSSCFHCCCCHCCYCSVCCCCTSFENGAHTSSVVATSPCYSNCGCGLNPDSNAEGYFSCGSGPSKRAKYEPGVDKRRTNSAGSPRLNCCCLHRHRCSVNNDDVKKSNCCSILSSPGTLPPLKSNSSEFRHPPSPPTTSGPNTRLADANKRSTVDNTGSGAGTSGSTGTNYSISNGQPKCTNNTAQSAAEVSSAPSTRRYNRRVVLPPVRMTHNAEVNLLLREIMERNSQAINFDSREMHMAVQQRLRSRNSHANSTSGSASGRASSISSTDGSVDASWSQALSGSRTPDGTGGTGSAMDEDDLFRRSKYRAVCPGPHHCCRCCNQCNHHHHCSRTQAFHSPCCVHLDSSTPLKHLP